MAVYSLHIGDDQTFAICALTDEGAIAITQDSLDLIATYDASVRLVEDRSGRVLIGDVVVARDEAK